MKKKIISILLAIVMLFGIIPLGGISVFAEEKTDNQYVVRSWDGTKVTEQFVDIPSATTVTSTATVWENGWYVADGTVDISSVRVGGNVNLILKGGCKLTVGGITVTGSDSLTIYAQKGGTGELISKASANNYAGIGGGSKDDGGIITIHGGKITATGGNMAAGIGGGFQGACGDVVIYGGEVTAAGGFNGAGIGTGSAPRNNGGSIAIYGGKVTVSTSDNSAMGDQKPRAIGGGFNGSVGTITIGSKMEVTDGSGNAVTLNNTWAETLIGSSYTICEKEPEEPEEPEPTGVKYLYYDESEKKYIPDYCDTFTPVTQDTTEWEDGWYVVDEDVTIDGDVTISDDVSLILTDGKTLTVTGSIVGYKCNIEIYAQSEGENVGTLNTQEIYFLLDMDNSYENVLIDGGRINISGGSAGISAFDLKINGGSINISDESYGIDVSGQLTVNGGNVTATGSYTGIRCIYESSSMTINGGSVIAKSSSGDRAIIAENLTFDEVNMRCYDEADNPVFIRSWKGSCYKFIPIQDERYLYYDEESKEMKTGFHNGKDIEFIVGNNLPTSWQDNKWYYVKDNPQINDDITVEGEVHLILEDNNTLTVNGEIRGDGQLYIHSQSIGSTAGKLVCTGADIDYGKWVEAIAEFTFYITKKITVDGAAVIVTATNGTDAETEDYFTRCAGGKAVGSENITVNYGSITATGGKGGNATLTDDIPDNEGCDGGSAVIGENITVNYGSITATGGKGGNGGTAYKVIDGGIGGNGGFGGVAVGSESITVNYGSITATGGDGGDGGRGFVAGRGGANGIAIFALTLSINGGSVTATGGNGGNGGNGAYLEKGGSGFYFSENPDASGGNGANCLPAIDMRMDKLKDMRWLRVSDGTVMATGGNGGSGGNGGTSDKNGDNGANGAGVFLNADDIEIIGTVNVKANEADSFIPLPSGESISDYQFAKITNTQHTHDFKGDYVDNGDGTHSRKCTGCDALGEPVNHTYKDGVCDKCGDGIITLKNEAVSENGFIFGLAPKLTSLTDYIDVAEGCELEYSTDKIGTGTEINAVKDNISYASLTVVIFGDVNNDGVYDGMDAVIVNCLANGMLTREQVGEAIYMAADCNHDGAIDSLDVDILQQAGVLLASVDQSKTQEELQTNSAYVEYLNLIDQTPVNEETEKEQTPSALDKLISFIADIYAFLNNLINFIKTIFA